MADEKRRLVYELVVEAKGIAESTKQAATQLTQLSGVARDAGQMLKQTFGGLAALGTIKGIATAIDDVTKLREQMRSLGQTGAQAGESIDAIQQIAIETGQSVNSVASAYKSITDASALLGYTQAQVAELTEASTRAVVAQGGTAEQAAQQIEVLTFAIEKNGITSKELKGLLKENEVLQAAFEQATGKTTAELLSQENAAKLNAEQLKEVLAVYTELGGKEDVALTLDRITQSLITMSSRFLNAAVNASGLKTALEALKSAAPAGVSGGDVADQTGDFIGGYLKGGPIGALLGLGKGVNERALQAQQAAVDEAQKLLAARWAPREEVEEVQVGQWAAAARARINAVELTAAQRRDPAGDAERIGSQPGITDKMPQLVAQANQLAEAFAQTATTTQQIAEEDIPQMGEVLKETSQTAQYMAGALAAGFVGIFSGAVKSGREFIREMLQGIAQMIMQQQILRALTAMGFEKGAAFAGGSVIPFAGGGVVGSPTLFPMSGGRVGLMGEAGAEAIMPLKRGRDGRLGVSGGLAQVNVINQTGVAASAKVSQQNERLQIVLEAADLGRSMALAEMNRSIASGYGQTAQTMSRSYGLRRRV